MLSYDLSSFLMQAILIGYDISISSLPSTLYISQNGARTWSDVKLPFQLRHDEPIISHPKKENWLLALEDGGRRGVSQCHIAEDKVGGGM